VNPLARFQLGNTAVTVVMLRSGRWCPYIGIGGAASCFVGVCIGASEPQRAKRVAVLSLLFTMVCACITGGTLVACSSALGTAYAENDDVAAQTSVMLRLGAWQ
jgi:Na+-driven multidrug efflux pump